MKTINVSEATNLQLDWLVAKCEGYDVGFDAYGVLIQRHQVTDRFDPTTNPGWMHPIIEREGVNLRAIRKEGHSLYGMWLAAYDHGNTGTIVQWVKKPDWSRHYHVGPTSLIAAARCYVVSKSGETVEVPEEL